MLIQMKNEPDHELWIATSEIKQVGYYKSDYVEEYTAYTEIISGKRYERTFRNKEDAHEYCVNMVAQINMEEGK